MEKRILLTNIQRFSLHDGPGIRTTVFLKGCSLRCPWCANPENLRMFPEPYVSNGRKERYGRWISSEELFCHVTKDRAFYTPIPQAPGVYAGLPGGVTFSGGEPLLQAEALLPLLRRLREVGVHCCVETAGFVPTNLLTLTAPYIDLFYVDVKILDAAQCAQILQGSLPQYLANVEALFAARKPVIFRVPVIGGFTDGENQQRVITFIQRFTPWKVELIKGHHLGESKYRSLGLEPPHHAPVPDALLRQYRHDMETITGIETEICTI